MKNSSVQGKEWVIKKYDKNLLELISSKYDLDFFTAKLLSIRGFKENEVESFLKPKIKNYLPNPFQFKDCDEGVKIIYKHINNNSKVCIFGDYDVDGATSTGMMSLYFKKLDVNYSVFIPDRQKDGYGPSIDTFKNIIRENVKLIITLDCGTTSFEAIKLAKEKNVDVVVIDHHKSQENLPIADAVINPNRLDENDDYYYLCAVGVLFVFLAGLNKFLRDKKYFEIKNTNEPDLFEFLDLVMLGTICDVVPLISLNRAFVYQGLKIAARRNNLGLKTLTDYSKINKKLSTYEIGYVLGPKINAGGRIGKSNLGYKLLTTDDAETAYLISSELNSLNLKRKDLESNIINEAINLVDKQKLEDIIFLVKNDWHEGLIGIVASRLKEHYNRPAFILSQNGSICKGSARSIFGFDIGLAITKCKQMSILIKGGGHPMAGGFSIEYDKINEFKTELIKIYNKSKRDNNNLLYIDSYLESSAINNELINKINTLEPYGSGNKEPVFAFENFKVCKVIETNNNHVKVVIQKGSFYLNAICFNSKNKDIGNYLLDYKKNFNVAGKIKLNEWNSKTNIELIIEDIQLIN
ncbi:MAG: single-stranded-DNA-specific exonuclease RecJ [Pelagibacteraceae bacterium]|nr:single-stranded-DNA-specific exonuclease RecJ [Pelagibacteraceae bacterium]